MQPILPEQGSRPYQYRLSPRNIGSDIVRSLLPAPVNIADRLFGNNIRGGVDRMFGGTRDRYLADESAYMRDMMRNDPGNQPNSLAQRIRNMFGGSETSEDAPPPNAPWADEWVRNGSPPLPGAGGGARPGLQSRVGAGRGTTIAQGPAAQAMFEGMRNSANANITRAQARAAMQQMFGNDEK